MRERSLTCSTDPVNSVSKKTSNSSPKCIRLSTAFDYAFDCGYFLESCQDRFNQLTTNLNLTKPTND